MSAGSIPQIKAMNIRVYPEIDALLSCHEAMSHWFVVTSGASPGFAVAASVFRINSATPLFIQGPEKRHPQTTSVDFNVEHLIAREKW